MPVPDREGPVSTPDVRDGASLELRQPEHELQPAFGCQPGAELLVEGVEVAALGLHIAAEDLRGAVGLRHVFTPMAYRLPSGSLSFTTPEPFWSTASRR